MRLLLAVAIVLLFLWLQNAQTSDHLYGRRPCEAPAMAETAVSFLLSPLSLYSWLVSTLVSLLLSTPAVLLGSLYYSLLLFLAWPWCIATFCLSLVLTCLHVALYLLHLALVVAAVAILALTRHKIADSNPTNEKIVSQPKKSENRNSKTGLRVLFGRRVMQQG